MFITLSLTIRYSIGYISLSSYGLIFSEIIFLELASNVKPHVQKNFLHHTVSKHFVIIISHFLFLYHTVNSSV